MCEKSFQDQEKPASYEVRIKGHLAARWAESFEGLTIMLEDDGNTLLMGPGIDEAALHRLLRNVRDFGMTLLSVNLKKENPMSSLRNLQKVGAIAALLHGAAYVIAIFVFFSVLAPLLTAEPHEYVAFIADNQATMYAMILISYWVTGGTLVIIVLALYERLETASPALMQIATAFGLIWAALIIGSGNLMLADVSVVARLYAENPTQAETVWLTLDAVETGIVSGNEIVGSLWVLLLSVAALQGKTLPKVLNYIGVVLGVVGIVTGLLAFIPTVKDMIMIFGLGMVVWSLWVGIVMWRRSTTEAAKSSKNDLSAGLNLAALNQ